MSETTAARSTRRRLLAAASLTTLAAGLPARAGTDAAMKHIVLLGDSVFDNAAYVAGGPDVLEQLRERLPAGWRATLRAVDGSVIASIERQLRQLPPEGSHLVISIGGNDALRQAGVLDETARSMADALERLAAIRDEFAQDYGAMLDRVLARGLPTAVCTIYDPRFPDPRRRRSAATGLTVLNDCITRAAFARGLSLIDLRLICDRDEDYANAIEPSVRGGAKIAAAIAALVTDHGGARRRSEVIAGLVTGPSRSYG
jgi:lysophospholipase L1-like esterase